MQNSIQRAHSEAVRVKVLANRIAWQAGIDIRYTDGNISAKKLIVLKLSKIYST